MVSKLAGSRPPSESPNSFDHSIQVYLQARSIMPSKCITKLASSQLSSVSLNSLDYGLQSRSITASNCISKLAQSWPPSASPKSLDHDLQSSSPNSLDHGLQSASPNYLDYGLQLHLQTRSIADSKCISTVAHSWPPKCMSQLARLRPRRIFLSSPHRHF